MSSEPGRVEVSAALPAADRASVLAVGDAAHRADGVAALDDQVRLDLEFGTGAAVRHLVVRAAGSDVVGGYGHLRPAATGGVGHLVVHPDHRRRGIATALVAALREEAAPGALRLWAHGNLEPARRLADRLGFTAARELRQMQRALDEPLDDPTYPADVSAQTFRPGVDDSAWVEANADAFASHPEQGRLTVDDLHERMAQPWFDPAGFFLAERGGRLLGFHWTKVHPAGELGEAAVGEVYVVGVRPEAQGLGLGKALTLTGLHHLRACGLATVTLYVEADSPAATSLYARLGFAVTNLDVEYRADPAR
ncbi:MAG TPA: mycothiol synthase [Nocardioidaceae bacterium]|nr:mycothiol synthase [Nocardioidaceae bacterium]